MLAGLVLVVVPSGLLLLSAETLVSLPSLLLSLFSSS